jgi:hypothetical protein
VRSLSNLKQPQTTNDKASIGRYKIQHIGGKKMSNHFTARVNGLVLALLLWTLSLGAFPNPEVIGRVVASEGASVGGNNLPNSGTLLNNDLLSTARGGKALVEFSLTNRVGLSEGTTMRFHRAGAIYFGDMSSGAVVAEGRGVESLVVKTPKYKVEPAVPGKALYLVAMMPDGSTVVAAQQGKVAIIEVSSGQRYVLSEGKYAAIPPGAAVAAGQAGQDPQQTTTNGQTTGLKTPWHIGSLSHAASIGLVVAIAGGTAAAIAIPLANNGGPASPSTP